MEDMLAYSSQVVNDSYHEAARAVFFHRAGIEIVELYVYGEGKIHTEWPNEPTPQQALDLAAGCLAGPLSQYVLHKQEVPPIPFKNFVQSADSAQETAEIMESMGFPVDADALREVRPNEVGDDYEDALAMLQIAKSSCGGLEACYEATLEKVRTDLGSWWSEIHAVAEELMKKQRLDGSEAIRAMRESRN
ncbi:hypothetical protein [Rubrobacter indicoceani]|uniref:hypothetical protein n=1 Tax=Rubrobacter indicoceani TaxID=2051957 RepID=UPI000E5C218D|nr:hypothetical protein [Rubrobacter indicoceani]